MGFTFGLPMLLFLKLQDQFRKSLLTDSRVRARLGDMYAKYRSECWWWELVEMSRKLLLTVVVTCIPGTSKQVIVGVMISFVYMILTTRFLPYVNKIDDLLQVLSLTSNFLILFGGLVIKFDSLALETRLTETDKSILTASMVFTQVAPIFLCFLAVAKVITDKVRAKKKVIIEKRDSIVKRMSL